MATRKPGAQPGNVNSLKHGFYSRRFHRFEIDDLDNTSATLESEIAALRVYTRRLQEAAEEAGPDLPASLDILNGLGMACIRIASLIRTNNLLTGADNMLDASLAAALAEVQKELSQ